MNRLVQSFGLVMLCIVFGAASCNPKSVPQKSTDQLIDYSDDLSQYRPEVPDVNASQGGETNDVIQNDSVKSVYDLSSRLDVVLDTLRQRNFDSGELEGYTILVYSGTSRTEAGRVRNSLYDLVPGTDSRVKYSLPTYFVKIGQFYQQIEAQPLYLKVRKFYPDATIVPDKFPIE